MKEKIPHTLVLVAIALIACAVIAGYQAFYVPQTSLPQVIYTQKGTVPCEALAQSAAQKASSAQEPSMQVSSTMPHYTYKVNINTADAQALQKELDGIGPVLAGRIIEYRQQNGGFHTIEEIKNVKGIGEAVFADIENDITV